MKTGNKSQAVILTVVAIGAIGFLVIQLLPAKLKPIVGLSTSAASGSQTSIVDTNLPLMLVGDPFSHPKLAVKKEAQSPGPKPPREILRGAFPLGLPGLDAPGVEPMSGSGDGGSEPDLGSKTEENAGTSQQKQQVPQISLVGIEDAGTPVALLQVGNEEERTYRAGEKLAKGVWLTVVDHGFVEVRVGDEDHRIGLGEKYGGSNEDKK